MKKRMFLMAVLLSVVLICTTLCGCKKTEKFTDYSFDSFDTVTVITGFEVSKEVFDANCNKIKEKLNYYHKLYDIYTKYEGINNLCILNETKEIKNAPKDIIDLLEFSKTMYTESNGKVNVAMGSVLSLWHNSREEGLNHPEKAQLPDINKLKAAAEYTDINNIQIDKQSSTLYLKDKEMSLDVGAVAKGYATQKVADWMLNHGITGYILNVGGNVCIVGDRVDGEKWKVGIENPDTENEQEPYIAYLGLGGGKSLVTSGSYQRYYTVNGKQYHHIIDGETLMPAEYFKSVSVLCNDSGLADALSTALFCMSYEEGARLVASMENTEAMWVMNDGGLMYSENFKDYFIEK